jgi:hypothetical protein
MTSAYAAEDGTMFEGNFGIGEFFSLAFAAWLAVPNPKHFANPWTLRWRHRRAQSP